MQFPQKPRRSGLESFCRAFPHTKRFLPQGSGFSHRTNPLGDNKDSLCCWKNTPRPHPTPLARKKHGRQSNMLFKTARCVCASPSFALFSHRLLFRFSPVKDNLLILCSNSAEMTVDFKRISCRAFVGITHHARSKKAALSHLQHSPPPMSFIFKPRSHLTFSLLFQMFSRVSFARLPKIISCQPTNG